MDDTGGGPQVDDLAETTRRQNSNLQRLIDAVGTLLVGSRDLLKRLQSLEDVKPINDGTGTPGQIGAGPPDAGVAGQPPPGPEKS